MNSCESPLVEMIERLYEAEVGAAQIVVSFSTKQELLSFSSQIYRAKTKYDLFNLSIGFFREDDIRTLSVSTTKKDNQFNYTLRLLPKKVAKKLTFTFVTGQTE